MPISNSDRLAIERISRSDVEETFAKLTRYIKKSRWLAKSNRYANNTINRIEQDLKPTGLLKPKDLAQYITASALLHCADGWSYLGRAINCLLKGDPHRVVHLGYYAELRAALSILAADGIGVLNRDHFLINGVNNVKKFTSRDGTHAVVWECFDHWGGLRRSGELFAEVVSPGGLSVSDWFSSISGVENHLQPQARAWFAQWSLDLKLFKDDRNARNESSYRPDGIPRSWSLSGAEALNLATELWTACEPTQSSLFENVDRHILRIAAESSYKGINGIAPMRDPLGYSAFISSIVDALAFNAPVAAEWKAFLNRNLLPTDPTIFVHSSKGPADASAGHAAVLARATLLLRLSSGAVLKLIRSSGVSADELGFWWGGLGTGRGIWDGLKDRDDLLDLWSDVSSLFDDIRDFQNNTPLPDQTFHRIALKLPHVVTGLGGCERVAMWSLIP